MFISKVSLKDILMHGLLIGSLLVAVSLQVFTVIGMPPNAGILGIFYVALVPIDLFLGVLLAILMSCSLLTKPAVSRGQPNSQI